MYDVASGTDRHFDITFGLQVVESFFFPYFLEKCLAIPCVLKLSLHHLYC